MSILLGTLDQLFVILLHCVVFMDLSVDLLSLVLEPTTPRMRRYALMLFRVDYFLLKRDDSHGTMTILFLVNSLTLFLLLCHMLLEFELFSCRDILTKNLNHLLRFVDTRVLVAF